MDQQFTKNLQVYLSLPENERDIQQGATMLLQLNRNRVFFQNVIRRPETHKAKLFYELNKYLKIRLDGMTINGIVEMETQIIPQIENSTLNEIAQVTDPETGLIALGKRLDHDDLPESIKALWVENGELAKHMRSTHEKLKLMGDAPACDRYEVLKLLTDTDTKYRENWDKYDHYTPKVESNSAPVDANRVSANRKYLSTNKKKLADLKEKQDMPKYYGLLEKMQARYNEILSAGCAIEEEQKAELVALGLKA